MGRKWFALMAIVLCLALAGCARQDTPEYSVSDVVTPITSAQTETPDTKRPEIPSGSVITGEDAVNAKGESIPTSDTGKLRIPYTGIVSSVVYVTSPEGLPDYSGLEQFDDAYFQEHALVLVTETMRSGSVDVGIQAVSVKGSTAIVTLYHEAPEPGTASTDDMATWLLWAEVEKDMDYQWVVANPALEPDTEAY